MRSTTLCATLMLAALATAGPARAIGAGLEVGGFVGAARLASGGIAQPGLFGGGAAFVLSLDIVEDGLFHVQGIGRLEGNGFGIFTGVGAGAGGSGGLEAKARVGLAFPVVEPFLELGAGAVAGGGAGTATTGGVAGAVDEARAGAMWAPAGYLGIGLTMGLPLLPYFELRLGTHVGGLLGFDAGAPIPLQGIDVLAGRGELFLGAGYRF